MSSLRLAIVSREQSCRLAAARACDGAPPSWSIHLHESVPEGADLVIVGPDIEPAPEGAIRFDPARPGSLIDEVAAAPRARSGHVLVVTGTGGAGATTLALHLAQARAARGPTCLLDLDLTWGAAGRLGLADQPHRTWADADDKDSSLLLCALPLPGGFRALLSPRDREGVDPQRIGELIRRAQGNLAEVVVDCPLSDQLEPSLGPARTAVLVVPPTLAAMGRATEVLERHASVGWAVVTNRLGRGGETTTSQLERRLGRRIAIELPCAPGLRDAEDEGRLVSLRWSRFGRAVARLERALWEPGDWEPGDWEPGDWEPGDRTGASP